jgi:plastocyanin
MAAIGFGLATAGLVVVVTEDDPPVPERISAEDALAAGNPTIELGEMFIDGDLSIDRGTKLTVINRGAIPHNLSFEGGSLHTPDLNTDDAAELDVTSLEPATYRVFCTIEGHRGAGMEADLVVESG